MSRISRKAFFDGMAKRVLSKEEMPKNRCNPRCKYLSGCEEKDSHITYCPQAEWKKRNTTKAERWANRLVRGL